MDSQNREFYILGEKDFILCDILVRYTFLLIFA